MTFAPRTESTLLTPVIYFLAGGSTREGERLCFAVCSLPPALVLEAYAEGSWPFLLSLTSLKLEDFPLATEKELAMARGEGRPQQGVAGGIMASIAGLGGGATGAAAGVAANHRALEEAFVVQGEGRRVLNLEGFVQEDFGVVFDEVRIE